MMIPNAGFGLLSFRSSDYLVWFDDSVVSPCGDESAILHKIQTDKNLAIAIYKLKFSGCIPNPHFYLPFNFVTHPLNMCK